MSSSPHQLGFGFDEILEQEETASLPSTLEDGIVHYRALLEKHHEAMFAGDEATALAMRDEGNRLAVKLNNGEPGILSGPDAPGHLLMRETTAQSGTVPMWGQRGDFTVTIDEMPVHIVMDGMIGACASMDIWPGFSANVVEPEKPFISETGYRSFLGVHANLSPGLTPDAFVREVVAAHIKGPCKGKLRRVCDMKMTDCRVLFFFVSILQVCKT
jgi:hypothetical protein